MAIALDISTDGGTASSATSLTWAHTCTGSNLILLVGCTADTDVITGVTYNGVAMTQLAKNTAGTGTGVLYIYGLVAPATGANNVVVSSSSTTLLGISASYSNCKQTGLPDASATGVLTGVGSGTWTGKDITTIADNCWAAMYSVKTFTEVPSAQNSYTTRKNGGSPRGYAFIDLNGVKTPAGVTQPRVSHTGGGQNYAHITVSFAPFIAAAATTGIFQTTNQFWGS